MCPIPPVCHYCGVVARRASKVADSATWNQRKTLTMNMQGLWTSEAWRHFPPSQGNAIYCAVQRAKTQPVSASALSEAQKSLGLTLVAGYCWNALICNIKMLWSSDTVESKWISKRMCVRSPYGILCSVQSLSAGFLRATFLFRCTRLH